MKKKILKCLLVIMSLLLLVVTSCETTDTIILPDLNGKSRAEIEEIMKDYEVEYQFAFADTIITNDNMLDKFVRYKGSYEIGDKFPKDKFLTIYTTVLPLNPHLYKEVTIDFEWEGKSFINDGVGEVDFVRGVDGDTAWFRDKVTKEEFKLRFLGIDTPETHAGMDPWGKAAEDYTTKRLSEAKTIVLEAEGARKETYDRYLGFVFVDGELLNLELVELAYTNSTLSGSKYSKYFSEASINSLKTGRRFFGEIDPNYDYENKKFK